MIIDWQHHWTPEPMFEARGGVKGQMTAVKKDGKVSVFLHDNFWDLGRHIADMDEAGIDATALSWGGTGKALEDVKRWNQEAAKAAKQYPGRLFPLTPTRPTWGPDALVEVEHAIKDLGFGGAMISAQVDDRVPLDSPELYPFYQLVTELDAPVFVHVGDVPTQVPEVVVQVDRDLAIPLDGGHLPLHSPSRFERSFGRPVVLPVDDHGRTPPRLLRRAISRPRGTSAKQCLGVGQSR